MPSSKSHPPESQAIVLYSEAMDATSTATGHVPGTRTAVSQTTVVARQSCDPVVHLSVFDDRYIASLSKVEMLSSIANVDGNAIENRTLHGIYEVKSDFKEGGFAVPTSERTGSPSRS